MRTYKTLPSLFITCLLIAQAGCGNKKDDTEKDQNGGEAKTDKEQEAAATLAVKAYVAEELTGLHEAAEAIMAAAPAPDADGWNDKDDAAAVEDMRAAWGDARDTYERVEGAIAVLFPELDASTDERYDGFIEEAADDNLFDDDGATGVHELERILWSGDHPANVIAFESKLPNYVEASFPTTKDEATDFKTKLAQRLVDDTQTMIDEFEPLALEAATAYRGVIGSLEEQVEKVTLAASAEDESRYAQRTLADMRANLEGGLKIYGAFRPWVKADAGEDLDADIMAGFARIKAAYDEIDSDAIPEVPEGFDPENPSAASLKTPYGKLWQLLATESDLKAKGSLVSAMQEAGDALGIPKL